MFADTLKSTDLFLFVIAVLAVYRVAQFIVFDDAPFGLMDRFRSWLGKNAAGAAKYGLRWTLAELVNCPYCVGFWLASIPGFLAFGFSWWSVLAWLSIAGGQAWLESMTQPR